MIQNKVFNILIVSCLAFQFDLLLAVICKGRAGHLSRLTECFHFSEVKHDQMSCVLVIKYKGTAAL